MPVTDDVYVCCLCSDSMRPSLQDVTEHLERKHQLGTSAAVLANNMFVNGQACQEVEIILKEFEEKNAAIESMEVSKQAAEKDQEIKELKEEVVLKHNENRKLKELIHQKENELNKVLNDEASEYKDVFELFKEVCQKDENPFTRTLLKKETSVLEKNEPLSLKDQELKELNVRVTTLTENNIELKAENKQLRECVQVQQTKLRSLAEKFESIKSRIGAERKAWKLKIAKVTSDLTENKENLVGLKAGHEQVKKQFGKLQTSKEAYSDNVELSKLNMENKKLKVILKKREFNKDFPDQEKWKTMFDDKVKENMNLRKVFNKEKEAMEKKLSLKESDIADLSNKLNHALVQANLLSNDVQKHQQSLVKHFQTILTEKEAISSCIPIAASGNRTSMQLYEEALGKVVKNLTSTSVGERVLKINYEAGNLQSCLRDKSLSEDPGFTGPSIENNNNKVT